MGLLRFVGLAVCALGMAVSFFWDDIQGVGWFSLIQRCPFAGTETRGSFEAMLDRIPPITQDIDDYQLERLDVGELMFYDGTRSDKRIVLVGLKSYVFNVSSSREQYVGGYAKLAGKVITRALPLSSFKLEDMSDDVSDFTQEQHILLDKWFNYFRYKYPIVGRLHGIDSDREQKRSCKSIRGGLDREDGFLVDAEDDGSIVFNLSNAVWLYGSNGVRFGMVPHQQHLYECFKTD
mmetsp:Transcript_9595/g.15715  ORF Transcript_9595/g.15715 Transcript_9595/m.15715 type:complete len:235 (-) Transcript_9595:910-1614(-)